MKTSLRAAVILGFFVLAPGIAVQGVRAEESLQVENLQVDFNVRYREGDGSEWTMDIAMPKAPAAAPRPAIVLIHGGGWLAGDKANFSSTRNAPPCNIFEFARQGFVAVTINYRLSQVAPFPAALHDCKNAVRFLRANAEKYQIDPNRIGAWGNSAGGHLALMLAMVEKEAGLEGDGPYQDQSSMVQAVISDSGPIDLLYQYEHQQIPTVIEQFLGGPPDEARKASYEAASPSHYISSRLPPMLLIYGEADSQVGVETADLFVGKLQQAGLKEISYLRLGGVDHCPHSLIKVPWVVPAVNEFFQRTLMPAR